MTWWLRPNTKLSLRLIVLCVRLLTFVSMLSGSLLLLGGVLFLLLALMQTEGVSLWCCSTMETVGW